MLFQLDFSGLKSPTENQRKSNIGKLWENSMVSHPRLEGNVL